MLYNNTYSKLGVFYLIAILYPSSSLFYKWSRIIPSAALFYVNNKLNY